MWTYVTEDPAVAGEKLEMVATMLKRDPAVLAQQLLIGDAGHCAALLRAYAEAGTETLFVWPVADAVDQLRELGQRVFPLVT
jgi:hypothetical protein